jgi:hypothetical protein
VFQRMPHPSMFNTRVLQIAAIDEQIGFEQFI